MLEAHHYSTDAKRMGSYALPEEYDGIVNEAALYHAIRAYLNNQRQGTASTKTRAEVSGGGRKPWRQKGTGRARQGTTRAAQWAGGGVAFPPQPHSWRQKLPRKVRGLAHRSALNARAEAEQVILIDGLSMDAPKTATMRDYLTAIGTAGKVLLLTDGKKDNVYLSARNLPGVEVRAFGDESTYDVLWAGTVVIERSALDQLEAPAKKKKAAEAPQGEEEQDA